MNMSTRMANDMVRPSNVISIPVGGIHQLHPATFPLALPTFFIKAMTKPGDVVLDPFAGSGTTLQAAEQLGREWIGFEIVEDYVEICRERIGKEKE